MIALRLRWPGRRRHDGACAAAQFDEFIVAANLFAARAKRVGLTREGVVGRLTHTEVRAEYGHK